MKTNQKKIKISALSEIPNAEVEARGNSIECLICCDQADISTEKFALLGCCRKVICRGCLARVSWKCPFCLRQLRSPISWKKINSFMPHNLPEKESPEETRATNRSFYVGLICFVITVVICGLATLLPVLLLEQSQDDLGFRQKLLVSLAVVISLGVACICCWLAMISHFVFKRLEYTERQAHEVSIITL